jgi:hypothetical protein
VTYQHELIACGKDGCRRCAGGQKGHGPYWYAYWREGERTRKRYVGKQLDLSAPAKATKRKPQPKKKPAPPRAPAKRPTPATKPTPQPPSSPATPPTLEAFAAAVRRAAARAAQTPGNTFGHRKVFIAAVWDAIRHESAAAGLDLAGFKHRLLEAHRASLIVLLRADLTGAMDPDVVARSEIRTEFSSYNFIERDDVKDPWEQ